MSISASSLSRHFPKPGRIVLPIAFCREPYVDFTGGCQRSWSVIVISSKERGERYVEEQAHGGEDHRDAAPRPFSDNQVRRREPIDEPRRNGVLLRVINDRHAQNVQISAVERYPIVNLISPFVAKQPIQPLVREAFRLR